MEGGGGGGGSGSRRRRSLSDEKVDSPNLRDFLRVKQDDDGRSSSSITLGAVLSEKIPSAAQVNRTLLDIIRDDPNVGSKKSWRAFKDKLRLRRAGAAWISTVPIPASDVPIQNNSRMISRRHSTRFPTAVVNSDEPNSELTHHVPSASSTSINAEENPSELNSMPSSRAMMLRHNSSRMPSLSARLYNRGAEFSTSFNTIEHSAEAAELNGGEPSAVATAEEEDEREEEVGENEDSPDGAEPQVRMSLMALLAETDRQMGIDGSPFIIDNEEDEEEEEEEEVNSGVGEYNNCCVCMVRHKGAAFIPCGHTFCRLCSRELWVQRGNCPLCNNFILEILDIF